MSNHQPPKAKKLGRDYTLAEALGDRYEAFNRDLLNRDKTLKPLTVIYREAGISRSTGERYRKVWEEQNNG